MAAVAAEITPGVEAGDERLPVEPLDHSCTFVMVIAASETPAREGLCLATTGRASEAMTPESAATVALPTSRRPEAREKLIAISLPTPSASRIPTVAPAPTTAPPEVIGITPAAAERQITESAVVGEKENPSAVSRAALPKARVDQQANR